MHVSGKAQLNHTECIYLHSLYMFLCVCFRDCMCDRESDLNKNSNRCVHIAQSGCKTLFNLFVARQRWQQTATWKQQTHTSHTQPCVRIHPEDLCDTGQTTSRLHDWHFNREMFTSTHPQCY